MRLVLEGVDAFDAAVHRMIREAEQQTEAGVTAAAKAVGHEFRARARRLSGAHAASFRIVPAGGSRAEVSFGPTMVYSRKISLRFRDLEQAMRAAPPSMSHELARAWRRAVT